jgi:hypothetical protein
MAVMKVIYALVVSFLFTFAAATFARADVIVNNLTQPTGNYYGPIGDDSNSNDFLIAQEFTLPAGPCPYRLNQITLLLSTNNPNGGSVDVSIWNVDAFNNPTNEISMVSSNMVTGTGAINFVPYTNILLAPGIYYVVAAPTAPTQSARVNWAFAATTNWTGLGALNGFADTFNGVWENFTITNGPQQMSVLATPVAPAITGISRKGNVTTLRWPSALNGYVVDTTTNLASSAWQAVTNMPTSSGGTNSLTNIWTGPMRFYRLRQSFTVNNLTQPSVDWNGPIGTDNNSNDFLIGQEFTLPAGNYSLSKVTLALIPANGSARVTASIWSVGADNNPASQIAVVSSQLVSSAGNVSFVPTTPIALSSGAYYVEVAPTSSGDNAKVGWFWTMSTTWTGFGTLESFAGTYIGTWQNFSLSDGPFQMSVQVRPVP